MIKASLALAALSFCLLSQADEIFRSGFEKGLEGWTVLNGAEMVSVCEEDAASGSKSLQIIDESETKGATVVSDFIPAKKGLYRLSWKMKFMKGYGPGVQIEFFDSGKNSIGTSSMGFSSKPKSETEWFPFSLDGNSWKESTAYVRVKIGSWGSQVNCFRADDVILEALPSEPIPPPWKPQYKIKPDETAKLTPADVVGPDGVVYPNWTRAGVQGGIPDLKEARIAKLEDFGGRPDDKLDDGAAIEKAAASLLPGGGVVQLGKGLYHLDRPICLKGSGIVLRGAGMDQTKIDFRYALPSDGIDFFGLKPGQPLFYESNIHVLCQPKGLREIKLKANGIQVGAWERSVHSGNSFSLIQNLTKFKDKVKPGDLKLVAEADYDGGKTVTKSLSVKLSSEESKEPQYRMPFAAIQMLNDGPGFEGEEMLLAADGKRGDTQITLSEAAAATLKPGDLITVRAQETERRRAEVRNACNWGVYRNYLVFVKGVSGAKVELDQPLRIEFPTIDGSFARKSRYISGCAVEGFTIESSCDLWFTSIEIRNAVNCWARNVKVVKCGRNPVYFANAKFCTVENCVFDDAWFKGGGGTAYAGWEFCYDCLMQNVETFKLRHAPLLQWSASGNVIRNGVFHDSDAQWHSGWTNENLIENCVIHSDTTSNGGYGFGMWASPPEDGAHGPNGPRNVVYNCDVRSLKDGLWLGGMNENWIVEHNRFEVKSGVGVFLKTFGFDHVIKGNSFVLLDGKSPGVLLSSPDCTGVELVDNLVYGGGGKLYEGLIAPAVNKENRVLPLNEEAPRPEPEVPSIYEWQLKNAKR